MAAPEQTEEIRTKIESYLEKHAIYNRLRELMRTSGGAVSRYGNTSVLGPALMDLLRKQGDGGARAPTPPSAGDDAGRSAELAGLHAALLALQEPRYGSPPPVSSDTPSKHGNKPKAAERIQKPSGKSPSSAAAIEHAMAQQDQRRLILRVTGGRAFTSYLHEEPPVGSQQFFVVHVHFNNQRFRSTPVPATVDPPFDSVFVMDLVPPGHTGGVVDLPALLRFSKRINLAVCRVTSFGASVDATGDASEGLDPFATSVVDGGSPTGRGVTVELVSTAYIEWRGMLATGEKALAIELSGIGDEAKIGVPVGVLNVEMKLAPSPAQVSVIPQAELTTFLRDEVDREAEITRRVCGFAANFSAACFLPNDVLHQFFKYARDWWKEYQDIHPSFRSRVVKLLVEDEAGVRLPVCGFVRPIVAGRLLETPRHAARFVSLIPYHTTEVMGSGEGRLEAWHSPHTFLSLRHGDCEDHATLLCSLLLGFGLEAYVVVGTRLDRKGVESDHVWVLTLEGEVREDGMSSGPSVMFWESLTGQRLAPNATSPSGHRYLRVGCAFNHREFYANKQSSDVVETCNFTFGNDRLWKAMDASILTAIRHVDAIPLSPPTLSTNMLADSLQTELRKLIAGHRVSCGLSAAPFDDQLEYVLGSSLSVYELERVTSLHIPNNDFQLAVKRIVKRGYTFKGFPIVFNHLSPSRMMAALKAAKVAKDIMESRGDNIRMGVMTAVYAYPDDFAAVWVMLGVSYRPFEGLDATRHLDVAFDTGAGHTDVFGTATLP